MLLYRFFRSRICVINSLRTKKIIENLKVLFSLKIRALNTPATLEKKEFSTKLKLAHFQREKTGHRNVFREKSQSIHCTLLFPSQRKTK